MRTASFIRPRLFARIAALVAAAAALAAAPATAQSLGWDGSTGVFVTPLALTSGSEANGLGTPSVAYHFLAGGPVIGNFSTVSVTEGFARRFEVGFTDEIHSKPNGSNPLSGLWDSDLSIVHGKANITPRLLAKYGVLSVGGVYRFNDNIGRNINDLAGVLIKRAGLTPVYAEQKTTNGDVYVVATHIVSQIKPVPIILSAGLRGTNASLWGLGGNAPGFEGKVFGSSAFVVTGPAKSQIILAAEVAEQPQHIYSATARATLGSSKAATLFDIPTTEVYAVRLAPFARKKLNIDAGVLHAGNNIDNPLVNKLAGGHVQVDIKARVAFALSYGF